MISRVHVTILLFSIAVAIGKEWWANHPQDEKEDKLKDKLLNRKDQLLSNALKVWSFDAMTLGKSGSPAVHRISSLSSLTKHFPSRSVAKSGNLPVQQTPSLASWTPIKQSSSRRPRPLQAAPDFASRRHLITVRKVGPQPDIPDEVDNPQAWMNPKSPDSWFWKPDIRRYLEWHEAEKARRLALREEWLAFTPVPRGHPLEELLTEEESFPQWLKDLGITSKEGPNSPKWLRDLPYDPRLLINPYANSTEWEALDEGPAFPEEEYHLKDRLGHRERFAHSPYMNNRSEYYTYLRVMQGRLPIERSEYASFCQYIKNATQFYEDKQLDLPNGAPKALIAELWEDYLSKGPYPAIPRSSFDDFNLDWVPFTPAPLPGGPT